MDKQEYKIRSEEIKALAEEQNYREAADLADTIDWRRVKSVKMLCVVSDIYKMVRRYEDSKTILMMAYEKRPGNRMIVYALTELCLKQGRVDYAWEYYKEFCDIAPEDSRKYILLYKVYSTQGASLEEQIKVLEKLKEKQFIGDIDEWVYELAYLYHRIGFATKCVEECDEIIQLLGEGTYVRKAMELKMLHAPLTPRQQALYEGERQMEIEQAETQVIPNLGAAIVRENAGKVPSDAPTIRLPGDEMSDIQVKILDDSPYNTMNLERVVARGMEILEAEQDEGSQDGPEEFSAYGQGEDAFYDGDEEDSCVNTGEFVFHEEPDEADYRVKGSASVPTTGRTREIPPVPELEEIFFEDPNTTDLSAAAAAEIHRGQAFGEALQTREAQGFGKASDGAVYEQESNVSGVKKVIVPALEGQGVLRPPKEAMRPADFAGHRSGFDNMLSQEADGQISLVVPEKEKVEKQITGQMSIQDVLLEWEQTKRDQEASLKNNVQKSVLERTGDLFAEFEASKDTLIRELEQAAKDVEAKEAKWEAKEAERKVMEAEQLDGPAETLADAAEFVSENPTEEPYGERESVEEAFGEYSEEEETDAAAAGSRVSQRELPEELRPNDRAFSPEEKELFESFVHSRRSREQLLQVLDTMSLAAYTGNVLITGEEGAGAMDFAKNLVRDMKMSDRNFSGRAAKLTGKALNAKNPGEVIDRMKNGALIIAEAGGMNCSTAEALVAALQTESKGIVVMLVDTKGAINSLLEVNSVLRDPFNARIDIEALNDKALVAYGRKFAYDKEFGIDEMGMLALHTRIEEMQTAEHSVTTSDVRKLVKEAIWHAERKTLKHFFDVLLGKRYDREDMIVLREEDFLHYA